MISFNMKKRDETFIGKIQERKELNYELHDCVN
jgi:hypothetical protein